MTRFILTALALSASPLALASADANYTCTAEPLNVPCNIVDATGTLTVTDVPNFPGYKAVRITIDYPIQCYARGVRGELLGRVYFGNANIGSIAYDDASITAFETQNPDGFDGSGSWESRTFAGHRSQSFIRQPTSIPATGPFDVELEVYSGVRLDGDNVVPQPAFLASRTFHCVAQ